MNAEEVVKHWNETKGNNLESDVSQETAIEFFSEFSWTVENIPLSLIKNPSPNNQLKSESAEVQAVKYSKTYSEFPRIILIQEGEHFTVFDGTRRARASAIREESTIEAYVGRRLKPAKKMKKHKSPENRNASPISDERFVDLVKNAESSIRRLFSSFSKMAAFPFTVKVGLKSHQLGWYRHNSIWNGKALIYVNGNIPKWLWERHGSEFNTEVGFKLAVEECIEDTIYHEIGHAIYNWLRLIAIRDLDGDGYTKEQRDHIRSGLQSCGDEETYVESLIYNFKYGEVENQWWYQFLLD